MNYLSSSSSSSSSSSEDEDEEMVLQMAVVHAAEASAAWMASVISEKKKKLKRSIIDCFQERRGSNGDIQRLFSASKETILDVIPSLTLHFSGMMPLS